MRLCSCEQVLRGGSGESVSRPKFLHIEMHHSCKQVMTGSKVSPCRDWNYFILGKGGRGG